VLCFGKVNMECIEREKYDSKLAWLHDFKPYLQEWRTMLDMLNAAKTPMKEIGRAVLTMPVFTSEITLEEVKMAMENVSTQDVNNWLGLNIGDTLFAKRKRAYNSINKNTKSSVMKLQLKIG